MTPLLFGMIFGVLSLTLFAQTMLNIGPAVAEQTQIKITVINIAVSITTLFSGMFIVAAGGLADRIGRVKILRIGFVLSIAGSLLVGVTPPGEWAPLFLILGRVLQGFAGALIMPSSLALVKTYWEGTGRQRAVSLWSIGSWGGMGFAALFGGLMAENVGWRWIFFGGAAVSVLGLLMVAGTPESTAPVAADFRFDTAGLVTFVIMMLSLQVVLTQGGVFGWFSPLTMGLLGLSIILALAFWRIERAKENALVNFALFESPTFTGATLSNFFLNATSGMIVVAMSLMQVGAGMSAQDAGLLTLGYAVILVSFIRAGEKLLQKFGPRKPMLWGAIVVAFSILLLMQTHLLAGTYKVIAFVAFSLFGLGLAFYATPCTDAALSSLPADQAGSGIGLYRMASSLGASFGVAISATIFTVLGQGGGSAQFLDGVISFAGQQNNVATREAALAALAVNFLLALAGVITIAKTIPKNPR